MSSLFLKRSLVDRLTGSPDLNPEISLKTQGYYKKVYLTLLKKTQSYLVQEKQLKKRIKDITKLELFEYLSNMHNCSKLSSSSVRSFRASLLFHIYEEANLAFQQGKQITDLIELYDQVRSISVKDRFAKSDRTNSKSVKFFTKDFYDFCLKSLDEKIFLSKAEILLQSYLIANIHLGLRPHEWITAKPLIETDDKGNIQKLLVVKNSKHSNFRANGEVRKLILNRLDEKTLLSISRIINILSEDLRILSESKNEDLKSSEDDVVDVVDLEKEIMLKAQLGMTRVLSNLRKKYSELNPKNADAARNTTLYSLRHQAIANAKSGGLEDFVIAATFGHISTKTAKKYYGKKRNGWGEMKVRANKETIEPVLKRLLKKSDKSYTPSVNANLLNTNLFN